MTGGQLTCEPRESSLKRLRSDRIDLYQLHSPDPRVPLEDSIGALVQLQREGKVRHIGISNVEVSELDAARRVANIVSVQNRYNLTDRSSEPVLSKCERRNHHRPGQVDHREEKTQWVRPSVEEQQ